MTPNNWMVLLVFIGGMAIMLYGIFNHGWYLQEISGVFLMIGIVSALLSRVPIRDLSECVLSSVTLVAAGAFMVGFANTIKVLLEMGNIGDTIAYNLSEILKMIPSYGSAVLMSIAQSVMNLMIPSGSGQALATLPIMIPAGELAGLTRQCSILAFQIGDGVTNLFNPSLGGLIAMLGMSRVPFDRWLRFIIPLAFTILLVSWCFLLIGVAIHW